LGQYAGESETSRAVRKAIQWSFAQGDSAKRDIAFGNGKTAPSALAMANYCAGGASEPADSNARVARVNASEPVVALVGNILVVQYGEAGLSTYEIASFDPRDIVVAAAVDLSRNRRGSGVQGGTCAAWTQFWSAIHRCKGSR